MQPRGRFAALLTASAAAFAVLVDAALAQDYPSKPVRVIVPLAQGGPADTAARAISDKLRERLKQPMLVENRPGAGQLIGADAVAKAPADGYTLMMAGGSSLAIVRYAFKTVPFDPLKDLAPIAVTGALPFVFVANAAVPVNGIAELVAYSKANPGKVNLGIIGYGSGDHIAGELLKSRSGVDLTYVLYKGSVLALPDLLQGTLQLRVQDVASVKSHVEAGKLRFLAMTGTSRSSQVPEVPTVAESGYPGYDVTGWFAFYAPAGTPRAIVARVSRELGEIMKEPDIRERYRTLGVEPLYENAERTAERMKREEALFGKLLRDAGVQPQ